MSDIGKRLVPSGKKPKSPRKGKLTRQQIILIVVVVVLAIALAVTLALRSLFVRPELPVRNDPQNTVDKDGDGKPDGPEPIASGPVAAMESGRARITGPSWSWAGIPAAAEIRTPCCWPATT